MSSEAVQLALAMHREPGRSAELRERGLPEDVGLLIRVAAGESGALETCAETTGYPPEHLLDASVFYLQQVLFAPGADPYQVLGVAPDAPQEQLREHYRWLIRWLHPDRNSDGWEAVYADRVNASWQQLKTEARRAEYDAQATHASTALVPVPGSYTAPRRPQLHPTHSGGPILSGTLVRRLPVLIIGGMAVTAAGVLGLMFLAQSDARREAESRMQKAQIAAAQPVAETPAPDAAPEAATATVVSVASAAKLVPATAIQSDLEVPSAPVAPAAGSGAVLVADSPGFPESSAQLAGPAAAAQVPRSRPGADSPALATTPDPPAATASAPSSVQSPQAASSLEPAMPMAQAPRIPEPAPTARATPRSAPASAPASASALAPSAPRATAAPAATAARPAVPAPTPAPAPSKAAAPAPAPVVMPAAAATPVLAVATPARPLGPESRSGARTLVADLVQAFAAGNLSQFDALFTSTTRHALDVDALRSAMRSSQMRYLELGDISWEWREDSVLGHAPYRQTVLPLGEKKAVTDSGEMRWVLRMDADRLRISSLVLASASRN